MIFEGRAMIDDIAASHIKVPLLWKAVLVKQQHIAWHRKPRLNVQERDVIAGPQVYKWVLEDKNQKVEAVYIGETERFETRLGSYRIGNANAPAKTQRIRQELKRCEDEGGLIELQFLDLELGQFMMNGILVNRLLMAEHTARILMESIAVFVAGAEGYRVLNHSRKNVAKKNIVKLLIQMKVKGKPLDSVLQMLDISPQSS
jgi:hypothetical protein